MIDNVEPNQGEILAWLQDQNFGRITESMRGNLAQRAADLAEMQSSWSRSLEGLPWRWIRPVVRIALVSKIHPTGVMGLASRWSQDREFIRAARRQVEQFEGGNG